MKQQKRNLLIISIVCFLTFYQFSFAQGVHHWEMIVGAADTWDYFIGKTEPQSDWYTLDFADTSWLKGQGGIGYGDGDDRTEIESTISLFMRIKFSVLDTDVISNAVLNIDYDDAFVAYLNGVEIARSNIGTIGDHPAYDQGATGLREATMYNGGLPEYYHLSTQQASELLLPGSNVLAIQVHNESITSSDISSIPFFSLGIKDTSNTYRVVPDWFNAPVDFVSSNLPIIIINTDGQQIFNEPKITARMGVIDNPVGGNSLSDPFNNYDGAIGIELHGQSSLGFAKKSYGIETRDSLGENLNVSLLDMPKENDWILYGPYSDKTLIRNALSYTLAGNLGRYAPRIRFCELFLNGAYRGVYVLTEKIKRDKNRINITEMLPGEINEPEISGGYIFKKDKTNGGDNIIQLQRGLELIIVEPKKDEIAPEQTNWLIDHLNNFEDLLYSGGNYSNYIDIHSFVDNYLMVELTKNIDGLRLSTYFHKDRNGKIVAAPVWDYNLSLGNADYNFGWTPEGWYYHTITWDNNWWLKLIEDQAFENLSRARWEELRTNQFSETYIFSLIDEWAGLLDDAQKRNFDTYQILGIYVWPNPGFPESGSFDYNAPTSNGPTTYEEEISSLKSFIHQRLLWMDENLPGEVTSISFDEKEDDVPDILSHPFPNPFNSSSKIEYKIDKPGFVTISIFDALGKTIKTEKSYAVAKGNYTFRWDGFGNTQTQVASAVYFYVIKLQNRVIQKGKFVKID